MIERERTDLSPAERTEDIPRALEALRRAVEAALQRHKRNGNPVAVWRNSRVEWVQPEDIPDRLPPLTEE